MRSYFCVKELLSARKNCLSVFTLWIFNFTLRFYQWYIFVTFITLIQFYIVLIYWKKATFQISMFSSLYSFSFVLFIFDYFFCKYRLFCFWIKFKWFTDMPRHCAISQIVPPCLAESTVTIRCRSEKHFKFAVPKRPSMSSPNGTMLEGSLYV